MSVLGLTLNPNSNPNLNLRPGQISDPAQIMKNMLEANFKDKEVVIRPITRGGRISKILWFIIIY